MKAQIALRDVAVPALHLAHLCDASGSKGHAGADGGTIAGRAHQFEHDAMIRVWGVVDQDRRRTIDVEHHGVDVAVVVEITKGNAPARLQRLVDRKSTRL